MVLYFSGTGNSGYAAKRIGAATGDAVLNLFEKIKTDDRSPVYSQNPWVIVTPTYAWRIPRIVQAWIEGTELSGSRQIYFVMTCGGEIGNAGEYIKRLCRYKGFEYMGCAEIIMPENYVAMFPVPGREESLACIARAESVIDGVIDKIKNGAVLPDKKATVKDILLSSAVNEIFYSLIVKDKKFRNTSKCISCGKCADVCPLSNIKIINGGPVWQGRCTHCMACICLCPAEAIEYGRSSVAKPRYKCPAGE